MYNHPANKYRNFRAKYFGMARKHDFRTAYYILEKDRENSSLNDKNYTGLLSELIFLEAHYDDFDLDPTLDCGSHADFIGFFKNSNARFDVTSNLDYKNLDDYEPMQKQGRPYYIALIKPDRRKVEKIVDINIPFCEVCGGRLINTVIVEGINYTRQGTPTQTERVVKVCSNDLSHNIDYASFNYFVPTIDEAEHHLCEKYHDDQEYLQNKLDQLPDKYGIDHSLFFSKKIDEKIHACAHDVFRMTDKDGGGYTETELFWTTDLVDGIYPQEFGEPL